MSSSQNEFTSSAAEGTEAFRSDAPSCATCRLLDPATRNTCAGRYKGSDIVGVCRRDAPQRVPFDSSCAKWWHTGWPEVKATDWCGHYAPAQKGDQRDADVR